VTHRKAIGSVGDDTAFQFIDADNVVRIVAAAPAGTI